MSGVMKIILNQEKTVLLTPSLMAKAFWSMDAEQQADFFHELATVVKDDSEGVKYCHGEMQWLYMTAEIKKRSQQAKEMFLSFSAFAYDYWPQKIEL